MTELSHVAGAIDVPLIETTIGAYFDQACAAHADTLALVSRAQDVRLTYRALREKVDALACGFLRMGMVKGDRLAIWSPNNAEWALTQFAAAKTGLVLVTINPAYRLSELEFALNKVGCKALVLAPSFKSSDYLGMIAGLAPELGVSTPGRLEAARLPALRWVVRLGAEKTSGTANFDDLLKAPTATELADLQASGATLNAREPINIQFTSGTTGAPKGATLTHRNILNNGRNVGDAIRLKLGERVCIPVPLYHCFGMVMGNLGCLTHGATMVYPSDAFDPLATLQAVQEEKCAALYGVPTMFIAMLGAAGFAGFDLSSLRTGIMAGSPCPTEVMKQVVERMNMREVTIAYGMTETSPVSFQSGVDDSLERRVSTVGRVQPHCEVRIVDETGATVTRGVSGELCTRGHGVMHGYWDDPTRTAEAIDADGFMHSGDLAIIDEEGFCNIVGRIKDMVIRGGENVYPREIEEFLYRHPAIADAQVVGVPDARYGEELCAWVLLREGASLSEEELRGFCQGQIAHYKIPRYVKFVSGFPMTVTGKVQKYLIRDQMKQELQLSDVKTA